ncbi:MAG: cadherin-like domain-containing protein [Planctomycetaceae bacterium]|nr:cadherin-like domain-containing protein [Planctomycetaceae bacterium]
MSNDTDVDGPSPLTSDIVDMPSWGTLLAAPDGSFVYTPNPNYTGQDSFTYRVFDGLHFSGLATVTLQVLADTPPVPTNDEYTIAVGASSLTMTSSEADVVGSSTNSVPINVGTPFSLVNRTLTVSGTDQDDYLHVQFANWTQVTVTVNDKSATYSTADVDRIEINEGTGEDVLLANVMNRVNSATLSPRALQLVYGSGGRQLTIDADGTEHLFVQGHTGDSDTFVDSSNKECFYAVAAYDKEPAMANMTGSDWFTQTQGFTNIVAVSSAGGDDSAIFFDSPGNDNWLASDTSARMTGSGFSFEALGF